MTFHVLLNNKTWVCFYIPVQYSGFPRRKGLGISYTREALGFLPCWIVKLSVYEETAVKAKYPDISF